MRSSTIVVVSLGRHANTSGRTRWSGSVCDGDADADGDALGDGEGDACALGLRVALGVADAVAVALGPVRRGDSLGRRGPPESARATTVPVSAARPIMTA